MNTEMPDFDALVAMHQQDPAAFERFRRQLLRDAVDAAPVVHRDALERLLERIEYARNSANSPAEAALAAFCLMRDSTQRLRAGWDQALHAVADLHAAILIERVRR